ncbi:hypothetical protein TNCV_762061, partial [Trichonephila clavipes]
QLRETRNIKGENTLSEGDIVLVGDDHTKRLNWNLGKILKLYPGKDKKLDWGPELRQVDTSRQKPLPMQTCSSVSDVKAGVEPRLETLELPDILTSDSELQQPGPRRSRYGRLLKPRKD